MSEHEHFVATKDDDPERYERSIARDTNRDGKLSVREYYRLPPPPNLAIKTKFAALRRLLDN